MGLHRTAFNPADHDDACATDRIDCLRNFVHDFDLLPLRQVIVCIADDVSSDLDNCTVHDDVCRYEPEHARSEHANREYTDHQLADPEHASR